MADITIKGRKVRVNDRLAAALVKMGKAEYQAPIEEAPTRKPEPVAVPEPKTKRRYQRRDMRADD